MDRSQADQTHLRNDLSVLSGLGYPGGTHRTYRKTEIQRTKTTIAGEGTVSPLTSQGSSTSSFFKCIPTTYSPFLFPAPSLRNYSLYLYIFCQDYAKWYNGFGFSLCGNRKMPLPRMSS